MGTHGECNQNTPIRDNMAIPDAVKDKVGDMPDVASLDKDALNALVKQLYDQSCSVFAEKFNMEHEIKKNEVEIHALELEVNDMHGKFIIPQLKKVSNFKLISRQKKRTSGTGLHNIQSGKKPVFESGRLWLSLSFYFHSSQQTFLSSFMSLFLLFHYLVFVYVKDKNPSFSFLLKISLNKEKKL